MTSLNEAVSLFKGDDGFHRLFSQFLSSYKSYGKVTGTVTIEKLTEKEREAIKGLVRKDIISKDGFLKMKVSDFEKSLQATKFKEFSLEEIVFAYFGKNVKTKKEEEEEYIKRRNNFFCDLLKLIPEGYSNTLLSKITEQFEDGKIIFFKLFRKNESKFRKNFLFCLELLNLLPLEKPTRIPLLASRITGDPHSFDSDTELFSLLLNCLLFVSDNSIIRSGMSSEEENEILFSYNILKDDITNSTSFLGLSCFKEERIPFLKTEAANADKSHITLTLRDIAKLKEVRPLHTKKVFIVENSSLFSTLLDEFEGREKMPSIICTFGQFKVSSLYLIDLLCEQEDIEVFYAGDFDPEGIQMVHRLLKRHPEKIKPWRCSVKDYLSTKPIKKISDKRLSILEKIKHPSLDEIVVGMKKMKLSGYQEEIIDVLQNDILNSI